MFLWGLDCTNCTKCFDFTLLFVIVCVCSLVLQCHVVKSVFSSMLILICPEHLKTHCIFCLLYCVFSSLYVFVLFKFALEVLSLRVE